MPRTWTVVTENELSDALHAIAALGFATTEFTIIDRAEPGPTHPTVRRRGTVIVSRRKGNSRTYDAGVDSAWATELATDLRSGFYGLP